MHNYILKILVIATALLGGLYQAKAVLRSQAVSDLSKYTAPYSLPMGASVTYLSDGSRCVERSADGRKLVIKETSTGKEIETLFDIDHTRESRMDYFEGFTLSPDASKILLWCNSEMIYRRSFLAEYYVYEVRSRLLRPLSTSHSRQSVPQFSPDSRMVAFVADNDIYVAKLDYQTEVAVTNDGTTNKIINGKADWTYEEEFGMTGAMTWSPDNLTLCYLRFDESAVPMYTLPIYEGTCNRQTAYELYPGVQSYKYPVAGERNSVVTLHSYDVETRKIKDVELPGGNPEYIPFIEYGPSESQLMVATLNRDQNRLELFQTNPKSTVSRSVYVEESKAWIREEAYTKMHFGPNSFVISRSDEDFTRYYEYSYSGNELRCVTSGDHDAVDYFGCDSQGNHYFSAAAPRPMDLSVFRMDKKGKVTQLTPAHGYSQATFSPDCAFMTLVYSNIDTPPVISICRADGHNLRVLMDNKDYAERVEPLKASKEFFSFTTAEGVSLNGYMVKPRDFNPSRRYPVVMSQYSGPGSQTVLDRWSLDWESYYANKGFIVVCVDGRGTAGRGTAFRTIVYKQLGHYETIDQIATARYLAGLPYVDARNIGIYGWSYGGYEALMCATANDTPFAAATAVAALTDWRFYDTVYTERFMLTPRQNERGYTDGSPLNRVLHVGCPLLLMYGTSDDNVHPANTLQFVSAMQSAGMTCDMFVFPNMNHSINGCNARAVVYGRMFEFFKDKLNN